MSPEFSQAYEIAEQKDLERLFNSTANKLMISGNFMPLRANVERTGIEQIPILDDDDIHNETAGTLSVNVPVRLFDGTHVAEELELALDGNYGIGIWHTPAYYYRYRPLGSEHNASIQQMVAEQLVFSIPKGPDSVYLEDIIHVERADIGGVSEFRVLRDRPLGRDLRQYDSVGSNHTSPSFNADAFERDFDALTKKEVQLLETIVGHIK